MSLSFFVIKLPEICIDPRQRATRCLSLDRAQRLVPELRHVGKIGSPPTDEMSACSIQTMLSQC